MKAEREALCDLWRERLTVARAAYDAATARVGKASWDYSSMPVSDTALDNKQALQEQTRTMIEYCRVLRIFTDVAVNGIRPPDA